MEVHSQTAPYLTFNDSVIPNHAYVDLSLMMHPGNDTVNDTSSTVICHTDLASCCRGDGSSLANWYFPDGVTTLPGAGSDNVKPVPIAQRKRDQLVRLQRGPTGDISDMPDGIYRCDIETMAVINDNTARETVYVGVYGSGGTCNMHTCVYLYTMEPLLLNQDTSTNRTAFAELTSVAVEVDTEWSLSLANVHM